MTVETGNIIQTFSDDGTRDRVVIVNEYDIIIVYPYGNPWRTDRSSLSDLLADWEQEGTVTII